MSHPGLGTHEQAKRVSSLAAVKGLRGLDHSPGRLLCDPDGNEVDPLHLAAAHGFRVGV